LGSGDAVILKADQSTDTAPSKGLKTIFQMVSCIQNMHRNREIAYTVHAQPKTGYLSLDESAISKNLLTRSG
jgi:hypothetical protein